MGAKQHKKTNGEERKTVNNEEEKGSLYSRLVTVAPYVPGDISPLVPIEEIPWIDNSLVKHGLKFYSTHLTQSVFAAMLTFLLGLPVKSVAGVGLKGQLGDPAHYFSRFLSTTKLTAEFFLFCIDPEKAYKTYAYVRKRHHLARNLFTRPSTKPIQPREDPVFLEEWKESLAIAIREDLGCIDTSSSPKDLLSWKPPLAVSQLDMVLVQFMNIWMFWGFQKLFGITNREEELKGLIHLWAIHGRMLGIQDEYNICLKPDPQLYDLLSRNFLIESLKTMDETIVTVTHTMMEAMRVRVPFMTYKAMLYIALRELQEFEGENLWKIMSFWDKTSFRFLQGWMWLARQNFVFRTLLDIPTSMWMMFHLRSDVSSTFKRYSPLMKTFVIEKVSSLLKKFPLKLHSTKIIQK